MNRPETLRHIESLEGTARWLKSRLSSAAFNSRLAFLESEVNKARAALADFLRTDGPEGRGELSRALQTTEEEIAHCYRKLAEAERELERQRSEARAPKPQKSKPESTTQLAMLRKFRDLGIPTAQLEQAARSFGLSLTDL